ncbi:MULTISPECIES: HupE/UreJ family protein [Rhizobium/Agrobacterium group]|uniref:HupE/UreJ family protein n=1 Tax=Rhizobium rhizogenes TaxID=359 RepID=A0A546XB50_RHIRH|nr:MULTISPECIES: HupE/UreJ family protein [Rhizobium/Agrobacterium group]TRA97961.1 HupE/UreJ family protein [Rhizobium rhizogenes]
MKKMSVLILIPLLMASTPALAHVGHGEHGSFMSGFMHPLSGWDHILAMVAVGLSAAMLGGRSLIAIPATFVALMLVGFIVALAGVHIPLVEPVILASTIIIGLSVAVARPVSPVLVAMIVGGFAFFHGHAHGTELANQSALVFGAGFGVATALLHMIGMGTGIVAERLTRGTAALRLAGGATALGGVLLLAS